MPGPCGGGPAGDASALMVTVDEYETAHSTRDRFIVKPEHVYPDVEHVLEHHYWVVEKTPKKCPCAEPTQRETAARTLAVRESLGVLGAGPRLLGGLSWVPLNVSRLAADTGATRLLWGLERVQEHGDAPPHQPFATTWSTPAARWFFAQRHTG